MELIYNDIEASLEGASTLEHQYYSENEDHVSFISETIPKIILDSLICLRHNSYVSNVANIFAAHTQSLSLVVCMGA